MADTTVYPFGEGQMPSGIGVVNDLTTGGADKALSAAQGKVLGNALKTAGTLMSIKGYTESQFNALDNLDDNTIYLIGIAVCDITNTLTNCLNSNTATTVQYGEEYNATLITRGGSITSASVYMKGVDVTSQVYSNGSIHIESVNGDIAITATATITISPVTSGLGVWLDATDNQNDGTFHPTATTWISKVSCGTLGNLTFSSNGDVSFADNCARFAPEGNTKSSCFYGTNPFCEEGLGAIGTGDMTLEIVLNSNWSIFNDLGDSIYFVGVNSAVGQAGPTGRWRFGLYNKTNKHLDLWCNDGSGKFATASYSPASGKQTLTLVRNNGVLTYYRNGVQVGQVTPDSAQSLNDSSSTKFCIGEQVYMLGSIYNNGLTGDVYDVKVYARALTAQEVAENHSFNNTYYVLGL